MMKRNELINFCNAYEEYTEGNDYAYNITREYLVFWYNNGIVLDVVEDMMGLGYEVDEIVEFLNTRSFVAA
jgi:hypothetical protein